MITFFARAGAVAAAEASGIAIIGAGTAGIILVIKRYKDRNKQKEAEYEQ